MQFLRLVEKGKLFDVKYTQMFEKHCCLLDRNQKNIVDVEKSHILSFCTLTMATSGRAVSCSLTKL